MNDNEPSSKTKTDAVAAREKSAANTQHNKADFKIDLNSLSTVKKVIAVVSGKGGVGKSLVTALLASCCQRMGKNCAILDADITGSSICKNLGIAGRADYNENGILPKIASCGVKAIAANMFLNDESDPIIWRSPLIVSMVKQFWSDVIWDNIDYMFIDLPPGTGDIPLTIYQSLPIDGIVVITSPQDLVSVIVKKAIKMSLIMKIPVLGIIENYAYFHCPDNGLDYNVFGPSHLPELAVAYNLNILARLPIDPKIAIACDNGRISDVHLPQIETCCKVILSRLE